MTERLFVLSPTTVMAARVNLASATYPLAEFAFDNVTAGSYAAVRAGMTLLLGSSAGADDLGRQRVRSISSNTIYIPRTSEGTGDGELTVTDNAYITVLNDYRVWAKIPFIDTNGDIYKDGVWSASGANASTPVPIANGGSGYAGTIAPGTSVITVEFDGSASRQFDAAVSSSLSPITDYLWDVADGTITSGTSTSEEITVTFPAGFRWVQLKVTGDNGRTHTCHIPVYARNPASDTTLAHQVTSHRHHWSGQELSVRVLADVPRSSYPDGTLVMLWEDSLETSDPTRNHMRFVGWHQRDEHSTRVERTGTLRDSVLHCVDVCGRLKTLPGFPQVMERPYYEIEITADAEASDTSLTVAPLPTSIPNSTQLPISGTTNVVTLTASASSSATSLTVAALDDALPAGTRLLYPAPASKWSQTRYPNVFYYLHYLLHWHSTALEVADLLLGGQILNNFEFKILSSDAGTLYDQVNSLANNVTPDHHLTCNRFGQMQLVVDPLIQHTGDRTSTIMQTITDASWREISFAYDRPPRVYKVLTYAIENNAAVVVPLAALAPGEAEGQGTGYIETSERITDNQFDLNNTTGNRYARLNARYGLFTLTMPYSKVGSAVDPAHMTWVRLTVDSGNQPPRGLPFTNQRGLLHEISVTREYTRTGVVMTATLTWEMETSGAPAVTVELTSYE